MSSAGSSTPPVPARAHDQVLGYLLKHAYLELEEQTDAALEPLGTTARDLGALRVVAAAAGRSQQEVAAVLGVDRTSMVALLDRLERKAIIARRPSTQDRRRNVVELTPAGRELFEQAERICLQVEEEFTRSIGSRRAGELRRTLQSLLTVPAAGAAAPEQLP